MRALSLFAGIGGLDYGLELAGIHTILQVENDRWCQAVLEYHWPEVQRIADVREVDASTQFRGGGDVARAGRVADAERSRPARGRRGYTGGFDHGENAADGLKRIERVRGRQSDAEWAGSAASGIDLIHGGFPCQDVSVAGKRAGLSGERSGLWFEFRRIVSELRPRWVIVENVPGLLSSHQGRDFGVVLRGLADLGYGWAYRVLDARWFGTPQRRRRVVVVGCLGDAARAAQVLAVCESCGGDSPPSPEARQDVAFTLAGGAPDTSRRIGNAWNTTYLAATLSSGSHPESNLPGRHHEDDDNLIVASMIDDGMARPLVARASGYRMDIESENFVAYPIRASDGHHGWSGPRGDGDDNLVVAVDDPVAGFYHHRGQANDTAYTEGATPPILGERMPSIMGAGVRRLTPLECERLQGFPDGWTAIDGIADAHRYRMLGNAVDTVVAQWLGHRLVEVDSWFVAPRGVR